ncbi:MULTISPECIES: nucleotidyltransferase family protein [Brevibacterium]|nr:MULTISPECIES: NTP transferase domain-containing protein [Brevibacterium]
MSGRTAPVAGLLLAAGGGRRLGAPKGLMRDPDGTPRAARVSDQLHTAGCAPIVVVVGAAAEEVAALLPASVRPVRAEDWSEGMGGSLRAGLNSLTGIEAAAESRTPGRSTVPPQPEAALVMLVDLPGVNEFAVRRVITHAREHFHEFDDALVRATWNGQPGHPVLIGRRHWRAAAECAVGDQGARELLSGPGVETVECGDLGSGADVDYPEDITSLPMVRRTDS